MAYCNRNNNYGFFVTPKRIATYTSPVLKVRPAQPDFPSSFLPRVFALQLESWSTHSDVTQMDTVMGLVQSVVNTKCSESLEDSELLEQWRDGVEEAATTLVRRYCHRLHALIASQSSAALTSRMEVEDIAQSVFSLVFQSVRSHGYKVPDHQELWGLLLVMALNKIRNRERDLRTIKRDVNRNHHGDVRWDQLADRDDAAAAFLNVLLEDELRDMPDSQRMMIRMRLEGYELSAIAEACHRSTRTVERVLQSFRSKLEDVPWTNY